MKKILCIPLYSVRMQENTRQKNSQSEYFSRSDVADFESMFQFHTPPENVGKWELKVLNLPNCYGLCLQLYTFSTDYDRPCFWHSTSFSFFHRSQPIQVISRVPNIIKQTT